MSLSLPPGTLQDILAARQFDRLVRADWEFIVLCLIVEDLSENRTHKKKGSPVWRKGAGTFSVPIALGIHDKHSDGMTRTLMFFEEELSSYAFAQFSQGLTEFTRGTYQVLRASGYEHHHADVLLDGAITIFGSLEGGIDRDLTEEICLDSEVKFRDVLACSLVGRDIPWRPRQSFWPKFEAQLPADPNILCSLMTYYLEQDDPDKALRLMKKARCPDDSDLLALGIVCLDALSELYDEADWPKRFAQILHGMPGWALGFIETEIRIQPELREMAAVLKKATPK